MDGRWDHESTRFYFRFVAVGRPFFGGCRRGCGEAFVFSTMFVVSGDKNRILLGWTTASKCQHFSLGLCVAALDLYALVGSKSCTFPCPLQLPNVEFCARSFPRHDEPTNGDYEAKRSIPISVFGRTIALARLPHRTCQVICNKLLSTCFIAHPPTIHFPAFHFRCH